MMGRVFDFFTKRERLSEPEEFVAIEDQPWIHDLYLEVVDAMSADTREEFDRCCGEIRWLVAENGGGGDDPPAQ